MKKQCSLLVTCLIVITCLASEKEAKSEPFMAILLGTIWTAAPYVIPMIPLGIAALQKAKEFVANRKIEALQKDFKELRDTVKKNTEEDAKYRKEAAKERKVIRRVLQGHGSQLEVLRGEQDAMRTDFGAQLGSATQGLRDTLGVTKEDLSTLITGRCGQLDMILQEVNETSQGGFAGINERLSRLEAEWAGQRKEWKRDISEVKVALESITRQQKKLTDANGVIRVKMQTQGEEVVAARKDCKRTTEGINKLTEKVDEAITVVGLLVQKKTRAEHTLEREVQDVQRHVRRSTVPSPEQVRQRGRARLLMTAGGDCSLEYGGDYPLE